MENASVEAHTENVIKSSGQFAEFTLGQYKMVAVRFAEWVLERCEKDYYFGKNTSELYDMFLLEEKERLVKDNS